MITLVLSFALAAAAVDLPPVGEPVDTAQPAKPEKPKKICKTVKMTGSHLGRRTCKTEAQWAAGEAANIDTINQGYKQNVGADNPFGGREAPR